MLNGEVYDNDNLHLFDADSPPNTKELFFEFHEIFGLLLLLLLIFHILGAIKHSIIDKDRTLRRMWFSK